MDGIEFHGSFSRSWREPHSAQHPTYEYECPGKMVSRAYQNRLFMLGFCSIRRSSLVCAKEILFSWAIASKISVISSS